MTGVIDWFRVGYAILHERATFRDLPLSPVFYLFLPESVNRFLLLFFSSFNFPNDLRALSTYGETSPAIRGRRGRCSMKNRIWVRFGDKLRVEIEKKVEATVCFRIVNLASH